MRERARDKGRLEDIIEYADNVTMLIEGHTLASMVADKRTLRHRGKLFKECVTSWCTTMPA
ncbi:MAG: hypothetical protein IKM79_00565 [Bacteroidales bacterium]|nr:hypothetical protein [Bacteroidales bacterium]